MTQVGFTITVQGKIREEDLEAARQDTGSQELAAEYDEEGGSTTLTYVRPDLDMACNGGVLFAFATPWIHPIRDSLRWLLIGRGYTIIPK